MILQALIGLFSPKGDGNNIPLRSDREGALVVAAPEIEDANLGRVFSASTAEAGVAPGTATGTTAAFGLYNPRSSGVNLVLTSLNIGYVSGTLGAGHLILCAHASDIQTAFSGTEIVATNNKLGSSVSKGKAYTTATVAAPTGLMRSLWSLGAALASSVSFPVSGVIKLDEPIVIPPGCGISLQGVAAAGTTPLVRLGAVWKERPIAA